MKFYIPYNEEMNLEVIENEFMLKYYPEMSTSDGRLFYWFGLKYVALEKNVFVHDIFTVKQSGDKTVIKAQRGQSRWLGLPFINYFIAGDFYDDVSRNFRRFLTNRYGYAESDILTKVSWWEKYSKLILTWLGLNLAVLLLIIAIGVGLEWFVDFSKNRGKVYTDTYTVETSLVDSTENYGIYEYIYEYRLIHKPSQKVLLKSRKELAKSEINNYAIVDERESSSYSSSSYRVGSTLLSPEGNVVLKDSYLDFYQADVIYAGNGVFYNLDGTRTNAPLSFTLLNAMEVQIAISLLVILLLVFVNAYSFWKLVRYVKLIRKQEKITS